MVKLMAGAEVMRTLEEVFVAPLGRVLEIWAEQERDGQGSWEMSEAGRYAFKWVSKVGLLRN